MPNHLRKAFFAGLRRQPHGFTISAASAALPTCYANYLAIKAANPRSAVSAWIKAAIERTGSEMSCV